MSKKIYGVPITTPLNPKKFGPAAVHVGTGEIPEGYTFQLDPEGNIPFVKTVNGIEPDENGNVEVEGGSGGVSEEQIATAVEKYLDENPINTGVQFETDATLTLKDGVLSVNTTDQMEQDNTRPITSAGVYATVGNIEALLKTI